MVNDKVIGRLSLYRRALKEAAANGVEDVYSHELASWTGGTPAQVRRDVMVLGHNGSPARGYNVAGLVDTINAFLDGPEPDRIALVGIGNLGRALLAYFTKRSPQFEIVAGFDSDPEKANRVVHGCRCFPMEQIDEVVQKQGICLAMITVPAGAAQDVAGRLCRAGIQGILNFAPLRIWVPEGVYVENVDVSMSLERVSFFARRQGETARAPRNNQV